MMCTLCKVQAGVARFAGGDTTARKDDRGNPSALVARPSKRANL